MRSAAWFQQGSFEVYSSSTPAKREPTIAPLVNAERRQHTMSKRTGKVAVVTSGRAGIGQGIVAGCVAEAARVFSTGRQGKMIRFVRFTLAAMAFLTLSSIAQAQYHEPALGT